MTRALEGIRVLDTSRLLAGPFCGLLLAELGAEVIKIEHPSGDEARVVAPIVEGESVLFLAGNRDKKGITLNLRHPKGVKLFRQIVRHADVVIESFRPGVLAGMGLGYDVLSDINPRLILVSVTGFGQYGPDTELPGYDPIVQSMGGLLNMTGYPSSPPCRAGGFVGDYGGGMYAALAAVAAIYQRQATGRGQIVDIGLLDTVVSMMLDHAMIYLLTGEEPQRTGNHNPPSSPFNVFAAADGYLFLAAAADSMWARLTAVMGRPDLTNDPRFNSRAKRVENVDAVDEIIGHWLAPKTVKEAVSDLRSAGVPVGPVYTIPQVVADPHVQARGMIRYAQHPLIGKLPLPGSALKLSDSKPEEPLPPPLLGQHNQEIFGQLLKLSEQEINQLKQEGAI